MKVFVTGGKGFIGSHICESIPSYSYDQKNCQHIMFYDDMVKQMKTSKCDVVSHHAAKLEIISSEEDPLPDLEQNVVNTIHVLQATKEAGIKRFIFASSACVYGDNDDTLSHAGFTQTNPNWYYGLSKLTAEKYIQMFCDKNQIKWTCLRYSIVYGEREWFGRVLTYFIKRAIEGKSLIVFDPDVVRDFIYVKDVVKFHNECIKKDILGIYNVSSGIPTTILELAHKVKEVTKSKSRIIIKDCDGFEGRRRLPFELKRMCLAPHNDQITSLNKGIEREVRWYLKNKKDWDVEPKV